MWVQQCDDILRVRYGYDVYAVLMKTDFESVKEPGIEALHDCKNLPEAMQWLRLAAKQNAMDGLAKTALEEIEAHIRHICQGCNKMRDEGCDDKPYQPYTKRCSKCQSAFYCSRECQMAHWKRSHKHTCCRIGTY